MQKIIYHVSVFFLVMLLFADCKTQESLMRYDDNGRYGLKTVSGTIFTDATYDEIDMNEDGTIIVRKNGLSGLMNKNGKLVIPMKYEMIYYSESGIEMVRNGGLYGFVDRNGKVIRPCQYTFTWGFVDDLARVQQNGKWGFIDRKGKVIIPIEYDDFEYADWTEGVIGACKDRKWGFIDKYNNTVIPFDYEEVRCFSEGLAMVGKDYSHWGYIDHNNNVVIPFDYENPYSGDCYAVNFEDGRAVVMKDGKAGCINEKGETLIPFRYYSMNGFFNGYAFAEIDNGVNRYDTAHHVVSFGYVDTTGKEFFVPEYSAATWNWKVNKAPSGIPDLSDTLSFENRFIQIEIAEDDSILTYLVTQDSTGQLHREPVMIANPNRNRSQVSYVHGGKWTLEDLLKESCDAFKSEPREYPNLNNLTQVSIACGLLLSGGNYGEDFMYPNTERWQLFKQGTIYKIIGDEQLRKITYDWAMPYYKQSFQSMHPFHQKVYKDIAQHLKDYINSYDEQKMMDYLKRDESHFAHYDADGTYDPYRKLYAFVDRLILLHKVISVADAKVWINKLADEVATW
ncbi:MAG TPA: WG repeat-containing protein [Bacteroidia bacterium]|jgi:hypothetical protein|nr:WG repeat-containing protein [Bacteroidia bacterium]